MPLITTLRQGERPVHPRLSLRDAYPIRHTLHTREVQTNDIIFTDDRDELQWKWSTTGVYTASSVYRITKGAGKIESIHKPVWRLPIPPTVRIFAYLLLKGKILTQDTMQRRNMGTDGGCQMCQNCPSESVLHLMFLCPTYVEVWCEISARTEYRIMLPAPTITDVWLQFMEHAQRRGKQCETEWRALFMCACWHIWKRRNEKIFSSTSITSRILADRIMEDGRPWLKFCNVGTRRSMGTNLLPDPD